MVTVKEIAKICNVSATTVSNIINNRPNVSEETRLRVLKTMKELNYTPNYVAKNLKMRSTKSIGVIVEDITIFSIPGVVDGISKHCEKEGYQILLFNLRLFQRYHDAYYRTQVYYQQVHQEIREFMARQVEGIIYVSGHDRVLRCIPENVPIPIVVTYATNEKSCTPSVVIDDEDGGYQITNHLISKGHKKIGVISGLNSSPHTQGRFKGYQQALFEHQILLDPGLIIESDWKTGGGYQCTDALLEQGATAIFCMNDLMAVGVYRRLNELNLKVGEDISVAGFDNREMLECFEPPLTTIQLPLHDIGYRSSEILLDLLQGNKQANENGIYPVKCLLIEGNSVQNNRV